MIARIARAELPSDTVTLARWLLGKVLVRQVRRRLRTGRIVETEAYLTEDPACHAFRGETKRNRSLFKERGHAYVYLCYGTSYLLNMSSEGKGIGAGVLFRSLEPLEGIEQMRHGREHVKLKDIARGPGRLAAAMEVDLMQDGLDLLTSKELWVGCDQHTVDAIGKSKRIGITKAADKRLRFFIAGSPFLSGAPSFNAVRRFA